MTRSPKTVREDALGAFGIGQAGSNREYLQNTRRHLHAMGVRDPLLERIEARLDGGP